MKKVKVRLGSNSYEIHIGSGILMHTGRQLKENGFTGSLVIITNPIVKGLYGDALKQNLTREDFRVIILQVPDGEEQKSLEVAGRLYNELTNFYAERTTPILALGGGVIGDLAGFVAATYLRGVPLIQIPTTLLAQADSSIGGKVAIDHGQLKNKIGVFYQPKLVITDIDTLRTLDTKTLIDGLAEVIKCAVIRDKELFTYIEGNLDKIKSLDDRALEEIVFRSAKIKAEIVEKDEKDLGLRAILNYGHTVGHAIESASDFKVEHAEAVTIGMLAAAKISNKMGILDKNELLRLKSLIERAGLPTRIPKLKVEKIIQAIKHDKKILRGKIRFVLLKSIGSVFITDEVSLSLVEQILVDWNEET
ncbi:MAG: 3-dehydroquinate synthase [Dehalococcoidia bacterium]|nr:MAG: 3-dehydroquinate synthase [Dehalococcoidia bacterium]